jgi:hypothetical protein
MTEADVAREVIEVIESADRAVSEAEVVQGVLARHAPPEGPDAEFFQTCRTIAVRSVVRAVFEQLRKAEHENAAIHIPILEARRRELLD